MGGADSQVRRLSIKGRFGSPVLQPTFGGGFAYARSSPAGAATRLLYHLQAIRRVPCSNLLDANAQRSSAVFAELLAENGEADLPRSAWRTWESVQLIDSNSLRLTNASAEVLGEANVENPRFPRDWRRRALHPDRRGPHRFAAAPRPNHACFAWA